MDATNENVFDFEVRLDLGASQVQLIVSMLRLRVAHCRREFRYQLISQTLEQFDVYSVMVEDEKADIYFDSSRSSLIQRQRRNWLDS